MLNLREIILNCKDIPLVERYLIASIINENDFKVDITSGLDSKFLITVTDGNEFTMEMEYDEISCTPRLIAFNSLDKILPNLNFNKMLDGFSFLKSI